MRKEITYNVGEHHLVIDLGNRTDTRIKILYFAEFLLTSGVATIFMAQALPLSGGIIHLVTGVAAAIFYMLAAYRFFSRLFFNEKLIIDNNTFTIEQKTPFFRHYTSYMWHNMGPVRYIGKNIKTDHPLKGGCYDYFGFETQEHLIQSLHHKGNLYFDYPGEGVQFARGVYSWDAEKMIYMIKMFVGQSLRLGPEWEQMLQEQEFDSAN